MSEDFISRPEHEAFAECMRSENQRLHDEETRQNKRLENIERMVENFRAVQASMEKMEAIMQSMLQEIEKQGKRLERLESHDGEMWRKAIGYAVTAVIGILIGFIARQIGL